MLHTLPSEVIRVITDKLEFDDKLNLCKTCHKLYNQISSTNLYSMLKIRQNTEDIIRMFQDNKINGSQVQVLDILMDELSDKLYSDLAGIFPNVTRFTTTGERFFHNGDYYPYESCNREDHIIRPLLRWRNSLKHYDSVSDWMYFRKELFCSIFPKLETLSIWKSSSFPGRRKGFDPLFLSKGITNAPMLSGLYLYNCDISIDSLEEIHQGCHYLRTLRLFEVVIIVDEDTLPLSIEPANSLLNLSIYVTCFDKYGLFLDYMTYKYPKLQDLEIHIANYNVPDVQRLLSGYYPDYKHYYDRAMILNDSGEHDRICENRLDQLESTIQAYRRTSTLFLSRLPKSMKNLELDLDIFDNLIEAIFKNTTVLSTLNLNGHYSNSDKISIKSDQLKYIKNLNSLNNLDVCMKSSVQSYELNFISNTITTLNITLLSGGFYINWLISMFPSLETLIVDSGEYLLVDENDSCLTPPGTTYPKLRKLDLRNCKFHPESLKYTKVALPNVEEFMCTIYIDQKITYNADFTGWNSDILSVYMKIRNSRRFDYDTTITSPNNVQQFSRRPVRNKRMGVRDESEFGEGVAKINVNLDHIKAFFLNHTQINL